MEDLGRALADERRSIADWLEGLRPDQWRVRTLCEAWDVHQMAAHLLVPCEFTTTEMLTTMVRARGNPDRLSVLMAARRSERLSPDELVAALREKADSRRAPPVVGLVGPYTDALVHRLDMEIPLGAVADERAAQRWRPSLDFLVSARGRIGFVAPGLPHLTYVASDLDWRHGEGPVVEAPAWALGLALLRRGAGLGALTGPGAETLRAWARA